MSMATYIRASTPVDGWTRVVRKIMDAGMERKDERGMKTKWCDNLMVHVSRPLENRVTDSYPFSEKVLKEKYATQLLTPDRMDFDYTYGERLNAWGDGEVDQIKYIIDKLSSNPNSRRAVATTWDPRKDTQSEEVPCLNHLVFMTRGNLLDLSVMIRSNDMYGAWLANIYALGELLTHVAKNADLEIGTITTLSVNAHIYEHDWENAEEV
jgi:thymidylate synthase